jgi:hypothetical protein
MRALGGFIKGVPMEGHANEVFADKFASKHGYAGAMATAMFKLGNYMNPQGFFGGGTTESCMNIMTSWSGFALKMLTNPFEEHPETYTRIDDAYEVAEQNLKRCKDKKMLAAFKRERDKALKAKETYEEQYTKISSEMFKSRDTVYSSLCDFLGDTYEDYESRAQLGESYIGNIFLQETKKSSKDSQESNKTRLLISKALKKMSKETDRKIDRANARNRKRSR